MRDKTAPLWEGTSAPPRFDPLRGEIETDVAIVGAGITGITAAALLSERGQRVVVLEKDTIGSGETGNTTAHITAAIDARYHYIRRKYSPGEARLVAEASVASIEKIAELISRHSIDCRFRRVPGYLYTEKRRYVAEIKNEARAAAEAGLDAKWTESVPLPSATRGAVLFANQAQFHPRQYLDALAAKISGKDCRVFERTRVTDVKDGQPCVVETEGGRVTAKAVLMATNVPIAGFTDIHTLAAPYRTYAMAFPIEDFPDGLFWDTADPYHYTRRQDQWLIVGGEDHRVGEEEDTEGCFARLLAYARGAFGVGEPSHRWSGQVIEPHGGLPIIGGSGNLYLSTGYAGQGITFGTIGAMIVADLLTGVTNRYAEVFDRSRRRPHVTAREFLTENLQFPKHFLSDRLTSHDVEGKSTDEVRAGEAKILEIDGKKVAAYRDDSGALHTVSPVCTHMNCDVAWNPAERTWDCPCHGSRFTPDGEVLNGPARAPLEKF